MSNDGAAIPTEPTYIVVTNPLTGWKTPVHFNVVDEAIRENETITRLLAQRVFDPLSINQHPGVDHCDSCIDDAAYDSSNSLYPKCCCRSEIPTEWLETRMGIS